MRIAMIGIKPTSAQSGGFETAVDELSRGLVKVGLYVRVYNRSGMTILPGSRNIAYAAWWLYPSRRTKRFVVRHLVRTPAAYYSSVPIS